MLPYCELRKWLISDNMLSDIAQQSPPSSFDSNWSCAAKDCCSKDDAAFVRVSEASVTHCNSSNIKRLIYQLRQHFMHERRDTCCGEVCARRRLCGGGQSDSDLHVAGLRYLSLSGCYQITDIGLRALSEADSISSLDFLDLSGCMEITSAGLVALVSACPQLDHSQLFYCDNMTRDPYAASASGCQNLECSSRFCCRFAE